MSPERSVAYAMGTDDELRTLATAVRRAANPTSRTPRRTLTDMPAADDPWSHDLDLTQRIALAKSILGHTRPADETTRTAVARALRALDGATIEQLQETHA